MSCKQLVSSEHAVGWIAMLLTSHYCKPIDAVAIADVRGPGARLALFSIDLQRIWKLTVLELEIAFFFQTRMGSLLHAVVVPLPFFYIGEAGSTTTKVITPPAWICTEFHRTGAHKEIPLEGGDYSQHVRSA